jgi:hypothetical protein
MFKSTVVLAGLAVTACLSGTAHADGGIDFTPFGPGGVQWNVSRAGFQTPLGYGQSTAQGYDVPFAGTLRAGCYVLSPFLPVSHGDGLGEFIADISSTWEGEIFFRTNPTANVFSLQVEILGANGALTTQRRVVTSASYQLEAIFFPTPNSVLYWGELDNSVAQTSVLQNFAVHADDQIRVSVCDLAIGSSMTVRQLVVRTVPFDH